MARFLTQSKFIMQDPATAPVTLNKVGFPFPNASDQQSCKLSSTWLQVAAAGWECGFLKIEYRLVYLTLIPHVDKSHSRVVTGCTIDGREYL
jgi:hypothetical protein